MSGICRTGLGTDGKGWICGDVCGVGSVGGSTIRVGNLGAGWGEEGAVVGDDP